MITRSDFMFKKIRNLKGYLKSLGGVNRELLWAQIWHDTAKGCEWLGEDFGVSPGRWAVGYDYLYVMTRVLEELRPRYRFGNFYIFALKVF